MKPGNGGEEAGDLPSRDPEFFSNRGRTRAQYQALVESPPEWLSTLRRDGPHPRAAAAKLGVSASGLRLAGVADVMTTAEIRALLEEMPDWLAHERGVQANAPRERTCEGGTRGPRNRAPATAESDDETTTGAGLKTDARANPEGQAENSVVTCDLPWVRARMAATALLRYTMA